MSSKMWINYSVLVLCAVLTHGSFTSRRTDQMFVDFNDPNTRMLADVYVANITTMHPRENRSIVKRSASDPPITVIPEELSNGPELADTIQLYFYRYPMIKAAIIGPQTFSCRQDTHQLVVAEHVPGTNRFIIRMKKDEFYVHPRPGLWWFVKCVGMETGGAGLDVTGVSKPGGDSGIDPNALKSLVG